MSKTLLAVDLGLKTGLCLYDEHGRLIWYRSRNYGSRPRLKRAVPSVLSEAGFPDILVIEGGGDLVAPWVNEAKRHGIRIRQINAEAWRRELLLPREQHHGPDAKRNADKLARKIIDWSNAKKPTSLRHDAAEAICI